MGHVFELAENGDVELMTHPAKTAEFDYLMSVEFGEALQRLRGRVPAAVQLETARAR
jgi:hypothetical protein